MGVISVSLPTDGTIADVADVSTPITTIVNEINGNLDNANIKTAAAIDGAKLGDNTITNDKMATAIRPNTLLDEITFDFVASGCVWSGDSYGSTRAASMTSGVVYIDGKRLTVSAVTARTFTASKDTYVDLSDAGNGTATITYTEVANNAASPALASSSVRIAIIITDATDIQDAGSVNQGQEDKVLPIASSIPYSVTDSLGNLICPRDQQRRVLGYRQRLTDFTSATSGSFVDVTGLNFSVNVPTGRKIELEVTPYYITSSAAASTFLEVSIYDVTAGAEVFRSGLTLAGSAYAQNPVTKVELTPPASGVRNYKVRMQAGAAGTLKMAALSTAPASFIAKLV